MNLLSKTITTANTGVTTTPVQLQGRSGQQALPVTLVIQGKMTVGADGTSIDAWVQTSLDGGTTWIDIAQFSWANTPSVGVYNLSGATPVASKYTPLDGALGANSSKDGILGGLFRCKYTTVGTYSGGTTLSIDARANYGLVPQ